MVGHLSPHATLAYPSREFFKSTLWSVPSTHYRGTVLCQFSIPSTAMDEDPLERLLGLEEEFYQEGYQVGATDGTKVGHEEGRAFGIEKGFEKFLLMGRLHGRAAVWKARMVPKTAPHNLEGETEELSDMPKIASIETLAREESETHTPKSLLPLPDNSRLEKHILTLHTLTDPSHLSFENTEDGVSDFDERLKRARAKIKIIEKILHEPHLEDERETTGGDNTADENGQHTKHHSASEMVESNIEDMTNVHVRR